MTISITGKVITSGGVRMGLKDIPPPPPFAGSVSTATLPESADLLGIAYGNGAFVAITGAGAVRRSTDTVNWSDSITLPDITPETWSSIAFGNGLFVTVSKANSDKTATSPDGIIWTQRTISSAKTWEDIGFSNGQFVALGGTVAAISSDGINWNEYALPSSSNWLDSVYGAGLYVLTSDQNSKIATSPNGTVWTPRTARTPNTSWSSTAYGNGTFVCVADGHSEISRSTDGISWTSAGPNLPAITNSVKILYENNVFVIAARNWVNTYWSGNGTSWSSLTVPNESWRDMAYGNGKFVTVGVGTNTILIIG